MSCNSKCEAQIKCLEKQICKLKKKIKCCCANSGSGTANAGNLVYVDIVFGNDLTGRVQRPDLPFKSPAAAVAASIAGYTIVVRPGSYVVTTNIAKDGVSYQLMDGVTITSAGTVFDTTGFTQEITIAGQANIDGDVYLGSIVHFACISVRDLTSDGLGSTRCVELDFARSVYAGAGNSILEIASIVATTGYAVTIGSDDPTTFVSIESDYIQGGINVISAPNLASRIIADQTRLFVEKEATFRNLQRKSYKSIASDKREAKSVPVKTPVYLPSAQIISKPSTQIISLPVSKQIIRPTVKPIRVNRMIRNLRGVNVINTVFQPSIIIRSEQIVAGDAPAININDGFVFIQSTRVTNVSPMNATIVVNSVPNNLSSVDLDISGIRNMYQLAPCPIANIQNGAVRGTLSSKVEDFTSMSAVPPNIFYLAGPGGCLLTSGTLGNVRFDIDMNTGNGSPFLFINVGILSYLDVTAGAVSLFTIHQTVLGGGGIVLVNIQDSFLTPSDNITPIGLLNNTSESTGFSGIFNNMLIRGPLIQSSSAVNGDTIMSIQTLGSSVDGYAQFQIAGGRNTVTVQDYSIDFGIDASAMNGQIANVDDATLDLKWFTGACHNGVGNVLFTVTSGAEVNVINDFMNVNASGTVYIIRINPAQSVVFSYATNRTEGNFFITDALLGTNVVRLSGYYNSTVTTALIASIGAPNTLIFQNNTVLAHPAVAFTISGPNTDEYLVYGRLLMSGTTGPTPMNAPGSPVTPASENVLTSLALV